MIFGELRTKIEWKGCSEDLERELSGCAVRFFAENSTNTKGCIRHDSGALQELEKMEEDHQGISGPVADLQTACAGGLGCSVESGGRRGVFWKRLRGEACRRGKAARRMADKTDGDSDRSRHISGTRFSVQNSRSTSTLRSAMNSAHSAWPCLGNVHDPTSATCRRRRSALTSSVT